MTRRSRDAARLAHLLTRRAYCPVDLRWDSDGRPWAWWVVWTDGPTEEQLRDAVASLAKIGALTPALDVNDLVYSRGFSLGAYAVQLVRHAEGLAGFDRPQAAWMLEEALRATPYPDRAVDDREEILAEVLRRCAGRSDITMWEFIRVHGLAGLVSAGLTGQMPPGVIPLRRPQRVS